MHYGGGITIVSVMVCISRPSPGCADPPAGAGGELFGCESIADAGFGNDVTRAGGIGFDLAAKSGDEDAEVVVFPVNPAAPRLRAGDNGESEPFPPVSSWL